MSEGIVRKLLLLAALAGLGAGLAAPGSGLGWAPEWIWTLATLPVIAVLAVSILRDVMIGRFGVDAIALVSMTAALLLDQSLAAVVVAVMYAGGSVLEDFARGRAERELRALSDRSPRTAHRQVDGRLEDIAVERVSVGDELLVRAGEVLPVDGALVSGTASIDESAVTGEPLPRHRQKGDRLFSGAVNAGETFRMRAAALADASTYAGIVRMVEAAQTAKAPFMRMADRFALWLLPVTLVVAALAWWFSGDPVRGLAVLVVATPCPLILAAPVAFIGGVSRAARAGVLMKGSAALEALARATTAIFDKTGTLTHGGAELIATEAAPGRDPDECLRLLASLEQASQHVLAAAVVEIARARGLPLTPPTEVREHRGAGIEGAVDTLRLKAGSRSNVLAEAELPLWAERTAMRYVGQPVLMVYLAIDDRLAALFVFGDSLRGDALDTLIALRKAGIGRIVMLTGDDAEAASRIGETLDLDRILAGADPAAKVAAVAEERGRAPSLMVGDGINDAPALATATVGIAMGARGATASSEAADIVVLTDRLAPIAAAVAIARRTRGIAMQSIVAGIGLSGIAMVFAALGYLTPVAGAVAQEAIDVAVILNALRSLGGGTPAQSRK
ncbi:heavy metal translocating P-type ATPase [Aquibium sp. ELW1220]|uniref:heavy metal translocating P-type ATPase n=1 Tax=Aquibium sp. ELW1220 TaxID=2976766 RepID=UPI0025B24EDA|nr:heavy metal translocating P-type ATPase [Aquibium sp. ELW1220]MDN2579704.1 heavy metal translocating P-type ATPase [Aquibium sp. ELW1220]